MLCFYLGGAALTCWSLSCWLVGSTLDAFAAQTRPYDPLRAHGNAARCSLLAPESCRVLGRHPSIRKKNYATTAQIGLQVKASPAGSARTLLKFMLPPLAAICPANPCSGDSGESYAAPATLRRQRRPATTKATTGEAQFRLSTFVLR